MTLEEEILNKAGKQMANDIDREILWGISMGQRKDWYRCSTQFGNGTPNDDHVSK